MLSKKAGTAAPAFKRFIIAYNTSRNKVLLFAGGGVSIPWLSVACPPYFLSHRVQ
jgi:hypothetical protein